MVEKQELISKLNDEINKKLNQLHGLKNDFFRVELKNGNEFYYGSTKLTNYSIVGMDVGVISEKHGSVSVNNIDKHAINIKNIPQNIDANAYFIINKNNINYFNESRIEGGWIKNYVFPILYLKIDNLESLEQKVFEEFGGQL